MAAAPGKPRGRSVLPGEYDHAVRGALGNDGWIPEEGRLEYSDDDDEAIYWHCKALKAENDAVKAVKAENASLKAEIAARNAKIAARNAKMVKDLFNE